MEGRSRYRGFTLVEILVVILVISILLSLASFSVRGYDRWRMREEVNRLYFVLLNAADQAVFQRKNLGVAIDIDGYEIVYFDPIALSWRPSKSPDFQQYKPSINIEFGVETQQESFDLSSSNYAARRASSIDRLNGSGVRYKQINPAILFLSSGEITEFEISISSQNSNDMFRIRSDAINIVSWERYGSP